MPRTKRARNDDPPVYIEKKKPEIVTDFKLFRFDSSQSSMLKLSNKLISSYFSFQTTVKLTCYFCKFVKIPGDMNAIELKNLLIHRISEISDISFLEAIKTILDSKSESTILPLSNEQRDEILASKKEIEQGLFIENTAFENEIDGWLNAK